MTRLVNHALVNHRGDDVPQVPLLQLLAMIPDAATRDVMRAAVINDETDGVVFFKGYGGTQGFMLFGKGHADKSVADLAPQLMGDNLVGIQWASKHQTIMVAS